MTPHSLTHPFVYKMSLSLEQRIFIIQNYQFNKSISTLQIEYEKKYGQHTRPARTTIYR